MPKMTRSRWLLIVCGGIPLLLFLTLVGYWGYEKYQLEAELAALRAQGMPTTMEELRNRQDIPNRERDTTKDWLAAFEAVRAANSSERAMNLLILKNGEDPPPPGQDWPQLKEAQTLLKELAPAMQSIREAVAAGGVYHLLKEQGDDPEELIFQTQQTRHITRLLRLDAHVSVHESDPARTLEDVRALFVVSRAESAEPLVLSELVRIANYTVACYAVQEFLPLSNWSDDELQSLQSLVRDADFQSEMRYALQGERAYSLSLIQKIPLAFLRVPEQRTVMALYQESLAAYSAPWEVVLERQKKLQAELDSGEIGPSIGFPAVLASLLVPTFEQFANSGARTTARQRCTDAGLAVQRYRLKHQKWPTSLEELGEQWLGPEPEQRLIDPFNGKPLLFKINPDADDKEQFIIYSVGENLKDDGGSLDPSDREHWDVGFAVKTATSESKPRDGN